MGGGRYSASTLSMDTHVILSLAMGLEKDNPLRDAGI